MWRDSRCGVGRPLRLRARLGPHRSPCGDFGDRAAGRRADAADEALAEAFAEAATIGDALETGAHAALYAICDAARHGGGDASRRARRRRIACRTRDALHGALLKRLAGAAVAAHAQRRAEPRASHACAD